MSLKPFASKEKAVVLTAETLTTEAQQALLKTLEEPPAHSILFLSAGNEEALLPTLISRCIIKYVTDTAEDASIDDSVYIQFWRALLEEPAGKRFEASRELTKERSACLAWLRAQLIFWRSCLFAYYHGKSRLPLTAIEQLQIAKTLLSTLELVERNISIRLALDQLFLKLPHPAAIGSTS